MVRVAGFEPTTTCAQGRCSTGLSYTLMVLGEAGFEPATLPAQLARVPIAHLPEPGSGRMDSNHPLLSSRTLRLQVISRKNNTNTTRDNAQLLRAGRKIEGEEIDPADLSPGSHRTKIVSGASW